MKVTINKMYIYLIVLLYSITLSKESLLKSALSNSTGTKYLISSKKFLSNDPLLIFLSKYIL